MNMNDKTYYFFTSFEGKLTKMKVLSIFELDDSERDYVIFYRADEIDPLNYYSASFKKGTDFKDLKTDLSDIEIKKIESVFETLKDGNYEV